MKKIILSSFFILSLSVILHAGNWDYYISLGTEYLKKGDYKSSLKYYELSLDYAAQDYPKYANSYISISYSYMAVSYFHLGEKYFNSGKYNEAINYFNNERHIITLIFQFGKSEPDF